MSLFSELEIPLKARFQMTVFGSLVLRFYIALVFIREGDLASLAAEAAKARKAVSWCLGDSPRCGGTARSTSAGKWLSAQGSASRTQMGGSYQRSATSGHPKVGFASFLTHSCLTALGRIVPDEWTPLKNRRSAGKNGRRTGD
jgi:hypothetical protein